MTDTNLVDKNIVILVADDSASMRALIELYLQKAGFKSILTADDGLKAWTILNSDKQIDVVISDWQMPNMSGIELLNKTRADFRYKELPFLIITSNDDKERIVAAAQGGVSGYVLKPFTPETLSAKIGAALEKHRGKQQPRKGSKIIVTLDAGMKELMPVFLISTAKEIGTLLSTLPMAPYVELDRIAAGLKGSAAGFGFDKLAELANQVIVAIRAKKTRAEVKALLDLLRHCFYNTEVTYSDGTKTEVGTVLAAPATAAPATAAPEPEAGTPAAEGTAPVAKKSN